MWMQVPDLTATLDNREPSQLIVQAKWSDRGLRVRFADGCVCVAPVADVLKGVAGQPTRVQIDSSGPLGVTLWFGRRKEFYPWDWLRHYGDAAYRERMAVASQRGRESIARKVRAVRLQARLTQKQLADAAGVDRSTIARLEAARGGVVTLRTLETIANAMGAALVDVFGPD